MKILIMAGGGGTRLWPLSREKFPKQFQPLTGKKSLLQLTYERLKNLPDVESEDICVSTSTAFSTLVHDQLHIPSERIIAEPCRRDNAAAILLSALKMKSLGAQDDEVVAMFPSDHMITNTDVFKRAVYTAKSVAKKYPGSLVQIGVRATYPETGYGYIKMGDKFEHNEENDLDVYRVAAFKEKPTPEAALSYVHSFRYLWNAGIFFFRIDTILALYEKFLPEMFTLFAPLEKAFGTEKECEMIAEIYPQAQAISIDYGIVENASEIYVLPIDKLGWSDVGHFKSLWEVLPKDDASNVIEGENVVTYNTKDSLIFAHDRLIACVGLKDMVIVDTGDVLLVTTKEASQDLKKFLALDQIKERKTIL